MNKSVFLLLFVVSVIPIAVFSSEDHSALVRIETRDEHVADGSITLTDEPCTIYSRTQKVSREFSGTRAVCAFDALATEIGLPYVIEFYGETGLLKGFRFNGTDYATSIWFAINQDFSPVDQCDSIWGVSLTTCDLNAGDELIIIHDQSSFYPFLELSEDELRPAGQTSELRVVDVVTHAMIPDASVKCGSDQKTSNAQGIAEFVFEAEGDYECVAEKPDHYRSALVFITISEPIDPSPDDPPEEDDPLPENEPNHDPLPPSDDTDQDLDEPEPPDDSDPSNTPSNQDPDPSSGLPDREVRNPGMDAKNPIPIRVAYDERYNSALLASAYLRRFQNDQGEIVDVSISPWAALAYASLGRAPYDVEEGGATLDEALTSTDPDALIDVLSVSRQMLGLMASGRGLKNVNEHNYCSQLLSYFDGFQFGESELWNDDLFAVLALEGCDEQGIQIQVSKNLIRSRSADGGFGFDAGGESNVDMTAVALQAFRASGVELPEDSVTWLLNMQQEDGGFGYSIAFPESNTASTAWAIQGLLAAGVDVNSVVDPITGNTPWAYLVSTQNTDQGFGWKAGEVSDPRMTCYVIPALMGRLLPVMGDWGTLPNDAPPTNTSVSSTPSNNNPSTPDPPQNTDQGGDPASVDTENPLPSTGSDVLGERIGPNEETETLKPEKSPDREIPSVRYAYLLLMVVAGESLLHYYRTFKKKS